MRMYLVLFSALNFFFSDQIIAAEPDPPKNHLEDIFIWKMSDELKLTAKEEKIFSEIHKSLNKKKQDINKKIQDTLAKLTAADAGPQLQTYRQLLKEYNQVTINEFDSMKKLLGDQKFVNYLKVKNELNNMMKSFLAKDKSGDKKDIPLPKPKIIYENERK